MGLFDFFKGKKKPSTSGDPMKALIEMMENEIARNPQACSDDVIPRGFGDFGLSVTNPVPVHAVPGNEVYLRRLRLENGSTISWNRLGSSTISEIWGNIDEYEIFNDNGDSIARIFINPYHHKISNRAPRGFRLV